MTAGLDVLDPTLHHSNIGMWSDELGVAFVSSQLIRSKASLDKSLLPAKFENDNVQLSNSIYRNSVLVYLRRQRADFFKQTYVKLIFPCLH